MADIRTDLHFWTERERALTSEVGRQVDEGRRPEQTTVDALHGVIGLRRSLQRQLDQRLRG